MNQAPSARAGVTDITQAGNPLQIWSMGRQGGSGRCRLMAPQTFWSSNFIQSPGANQVAESHSKVIGWYFDVGHRS